MGFTTAGPDVFLGSGHPDPRDGGPPHLGFIRSTDRAANWSTVSLRGEADFHALSAVGRTIYGVDATDGLVMRSDDNGTSWQAGASNGGHRPGRGPRFCPPCARCDPGRAAGER